MEAAGVGYGRDVASESVHEEFLTCQKARSEDVRAMLLRAHSGIEEEEKEWTESIHYGKPDNEDVAARILAGEDHTALIVVGSRGQGTVRRMALGSVSTKILRAAKGPVLIYPHSTL